MNSINIIIIGGGAAGFFAAINSAQLNKNCSVTLLEKSSKVLSKVRISGGGRCNVTHACFENSLLIKNYPRGEKELQNAFSRFSVMDTINWFKQRNIELKTEKDGRMFPLSDKSETIINCLQQEADKAGVKILMNVEITEVQKHSNQTFTLFAKGGGEFKCDKLIIATGGNPKDEAYAWLKKTGHTIIKPVPSLFTFNIPNDPITQLMGVAVPSVQIRIGATNLETKGPLLITHWGMSGPGILKTSAYGARILNDLNYNFTAIINWLPKYNEEKLRIEFANQRAENSAKLICSSTAFELPKRLWEFFIAKAGIAENLRWADLPKKNANILISILNKDQYKVLGKTTFKEEFVTCGGVSLKEIDLSTMQSKLIPNLFFAGEILDVDGITGGFNFQNAWSTGWIAAQNVMLKAL